ncbi:DCP2-domain-containing protein [Auriscalpium vulgare]|uniref:DCP2-domain-containing protein n=1 Tax=Auriscalpium vulgare TaxID=40419 RepID=A0ACB8S8R0_9AGAM|nr:DCP2-domain-containing protein [Auriscalpium vulgare]
MASSSSSSPEISAPSYSQTPARCKYSTLDEVLDDLSSRFILNLPDDELASLERICFQVEQAHWFYEDFIREENLKFPSLPLKKFSEMLFQACPLLHHWSGDHEGAFNHFMQYKTRVPVCGAIMLNDTWDKVVLVKGWKSSSGWGFPKGKINQNEAPHACAVREVAEETGYSLSEQIDPSDVIELSIREQLISLYIVPGVPEDYPFETKTRKEISKIEWFKLGDLPTWKRNKSVPGKFYLISPFIGYATHLAFLCLPSSHFTCKSFEGFHQRSEATPSTPSPSQNQGGSDQRCPHSRRKRCVSCGLPLA